jgi:D-beta-D-heptose 7-phosphate kinase/D-beta-D-heptose 1-phosphate adenosyltransferase
VTRDSREKIRTRRAAIAWRHRQSGPVVFTNGVFDLLHPGHVTLLEAARREGAALVVGLNADTSVRRLAKGSDRPLMPEQARARVVAAVAAVDCVVLFEEDTPIHLIEDLQPDVLVKGADYTPETTVGAAFVEARGGRVVHVPLEAGWSTTHLLERLRAPS